MSQRKNSRRQFVFATAAVLTSQSVLSTTTAVSAFDIGKELPAGEDLMQEHGVLGRLLLIYEQLSSELSSGKRFENSESLKQATELIIKYIQGHHERIEELVVFPALRKVKSVRPLVTVLVEQHGAGNHLTESIMKKVTAGAYTRERGRKELADFTGAMVRMYRPHALREDTVVYPALRRSLSDDEYREISKRARNLESRMINNDDLADILRQVDQIEIELSINDLSRFTASVKDTRAD